MDCSWYKVMAKVRLPVSKSVTLNVYALKSNVNVCPFTTLSTFHNHLILKPTFIFASVEPAIPAHITSVRPHSIA